MRKLEELLGDIIADGLIIIGAAGLAVLAIPSLLVAFLVGLVYKFFEFIFSLIFGKR